MPGDERTQRGIVFDIQRFSVHDGPGIRTTVFLKGCSLRCFWCQNPEGISLEPQIMFYPERCIGCGRCVTACPRGAHSLQDGRHVYRREICSTCGNCVNSCYSGALVLAGRTMSVDEVVEEVLRDKTFYEISGGGVTLSGGDPLVQHAFALAILKRCRAEGLHTAIETAANGAWDDLRRLVQATDLIIMDIKCLNGDRHRNATGIGNETILANATRLAEARRPIIVRVPIIPTVNDNDEEVGAIAAFARSMPGLLHMELLPFHRLGGSKYRALSMDYRANNLGALTSETMRDLADHAQKFGVEVRVG